MADSAADPTLHTGADAQRAVVRARVMVGEAVGDLMGFWNFKPSMGRVWTALYLSSDPLSAEQIVQATGLSVGSVSMTVHDLLAWGVVHAVDPIAGRRRFAAETDIVAMVSSVFRKRELARIRSAIQTFESALTLLDARGRSSVPGQMMEGRFVATRIRRLLALARAGHSMVERLVQVGRVDLTAIRDKLPRRR